MFRWFCLIFLTHLWWVVFAAACEVRIHLDPACEEASGGCWAMLCIADLPLSLPGLSLIQDALHEQLTWPEAAASDWWVGHLLIPALILQFLGSLNWFLISCLRIFFWKRTLEQEEKTFFPTPGEIRAQQKNWGAQRLRWLQSLRSFRLSENAPVYPKGAWPGMVIFMPLLLIPFWSCVLGMTLFSMAWLFLTRRLFFTSDLPEST